MSASPVSPKRSEDDAMGSPSGEHHSSPNPQVTDAATPVPQDDDAVDSPVEPVAVLDDMVRPKRKPRNMRDLTDHYSSPLLVCG